MRMQVWARRLRLGVTATLAVTCLIAIALLAAEVRGKLAALTGQVYIPVVSHQADED